MYAAIEYYEEAQREMAMWATKLHALGERAAVYSSPRGKNVLFANTPNAESAVVRHVYRDQM